MILFDFQLVMIGWSPYQYAPIHDHPDGGCLVKVAKGKFKENIYEFEPEKTSQRILPSSGSSEQFFCCQERNITVTEDEHTPLEGRNSYGCQAKGFGVKKMIKIETFLATIGSEYEVRTLKRNDAMHDLWNPFNETAYQLSHYLGDFTRITFWFPDDFEHDIKCKSRGDDPMLKQFKSASRSINLEKGCNTCAP